MICRNCPGRSPQVLRPGRAAEGIMIRLSQLYAASAWNIYFVTAGTFARRPLFQTDRVARLFFETIFHHRSAGNYRLHEFVVMPDHFHLLLTPARDVGLERAVQLVQGRFAYRLRKELQLNLQVWEREYEARCIRDAEDYERCAAHIRESPVRAQLSPAAEYYAYGSACRDFELDVCPLEAKPSVRLRA